MRLFFHFFLVFSFLFLTFSADASANVASMRTRLPKLLSFKTQGMVCEKLDGYLKKVGGDAKVAALVKAENKDRLKIYSERSKPKNISVVAYAKEVGALKVKKVQSGHLYEKSPGQCVKK